MKSFAKFALLALVGLLSISAAQARKLDPALMATNKEKFDDQAAAIRQQMKAGGHWEFVDSDERAIVERRLEEISALLAAGSADSLPPSPKAELLKAQEEVNAILTKKDGRRLICENVAPTGSHRKQKQCQTFAERERERNETQRFLRSNDSIN